MLRPQFPEVTSMLADAAEDLLAYFPQAHWRKVWSTNPLEVGMVLQHLVDRHVRGEALEEVLDGVPKAADGRLTMADRRV